MDKVLDREGQRAFDKLMRRFNKACADYGLIEDGDRILIGLSGGKDSLLLTELLAHRQKIYVPRFEVVAIHVTIPAIGYQSDIEYLNAFCQEWGVPFVHREAQLDFDDPQYADSRSLRKQKTPCFLCSWYRRKMMFEVAQQMHCNKLALGHHRDDIVQTLLLNMLFQGTVDSIKPSMTMDKFPVTLIRPLCLIDESDIVDYAQLRQYKKVDKLCPYERRSMRDRVKPLLEQMQELNPEAKSCLMKALHGQKEDVES